MNTEIVAVWVFVGLIFASMLAYSFFLGDYIARAGFRWLGRNRVLVYRKWGVERDLFFPLPRWQFIAWGTVIVVFTAITFLVSAAVSAAFIQKTSLTKGILENTLAIAAIPFTWGILVAYVRIWNILERIDKLTKLPPHFHERFSVTELLSMYEALRSAPPIFWEEYSNLEERQMDSDINRRYRENAAPFRHNSLNINNKAMLGIAIAVLIFTAISVVIGAINLLPLLNKAVG